MQEYTMVFINVSRAIFLASNIFLFYTFLTPKRPLWFQVTAFIGTWVIVSLLRSLLGPIVSDPFLLGYALGSLYTIPCALIFKETLQAKIFVVFMVYSFSQFVFIVFLFLENLWLGHPIGGVVLLGLLLEAASLPFIKKYVAPHLKNIIEIIDQQNFSFVLFPIFSFILLAFYGVQRTYLLANFIPLVLSTLLIFFTYYLISLAINRTKRHQQLEKQLTLERDHYHNLNESINTTKVIRHDLRHHMVTILEYLKKNNADAAQEYLNKLCNLYDDSSIPTVCRNRSADAIISHYLKLAKQQDIAVVTNLNIPDNLGIDNLDLCVVIGNCLENAIEACSNISDSEARFVDINVTITKGHLVIKIENSFNGLVQHKDDSFFSTKKGLDHGIGISSVKTLVDKYQGDYLVSLDQLIFKVIISLKIPLIMGTPQNKETGIVF